jgi:hypothetical protein
MITVALKWTNDSYTVKFINPKAMSQHDYPRRRAAFSLKKLSPAKSLSFQLKTGDRRS